MTRQGCRLPSVELEVHVYCEVNLSLDINSIVIAFTIGRIRLSRIERLISLVGHRWSSKLSWSNLSEGNSHRVSQLFHDLPLLARFLCNKPSLFTVSTQMWILGYFESRRSSVLDLPSSRCCCCCLLPVSRAGARRSSASRGGRRHTESSRRTREALNRHAQDED